MSSEEHDLIVRIETPGDAPAIRVVNEEAFGRPDEADLVDRLRENGKVTLSLVASEDGRIVGHILFTDMLGTGQRLVGLAPMAVGRDLQRQGIGKALVSEAMGFLREQGYHGIVVLGHPTYYPRFGFRPAKCYGIETQFDVPDECQMVLNLTDDRLEPCKARYQSEFDSLT